MNHSLLFVVLGAFLWIIIIKFGNRQFGGYDFSVLVDTPYRLLQGQTPFLDFYLTTPPFFVAGAWLAYKALGTTWIALLYLTAIFSLLVFAIQSYQLARHGLSLFWAIVLALCFQVMTIVVGSYWWYNSISLALLTLLIGQTSLLLRGEKGWKSWALFCLLCVCVLASKPNTGFPGVVLSSFTLFWNRDTRSQLLLWLPISIVLFILLLFVMRISPVELFHAYRTIAGRATPGIGRFAQDRKIGMTAIFLVGTLGCVYFSIRRLANQIILRAGTSRKQWLLECMAAGVLILVYLWTGNRWIMIPALFLGTRVALMIHSDSSGEVLTRPLLWVGTIIIGLFSCFTNAELQVIAFPILLLPSLFAPLSPRPTRPWLIFLAFSTVFALILGGIRYRVKLIGPDLFYQKGHSVLLAGGPEYFQGFRGSPLFSRVVTDVRELLNEDSIRTIGNTRTFFGPRMEWAYAAFRLPSPKGLPIWWDPGVSFPPDDAGKIIRQFKASHFNTCVFFRDDFTRMPEDLRRWIEETYTRESRGNLTVFHYRWPEERP